MMKETYHPINDTTNKKIQCHGSSIIKIDNVFYWYGENKDDITDNCLDPKSKCPYWHHGVKLYSSIDLISWNDEGYVIKESNDINNPFHPSNIMDRPHILYNSKTKQYVLWAKSGFKKDFGTCGYSISIGPSLKELKYLKMANIKPHHAGDFALFIYKNKGYIVYANPHTTMVVRELTDDFLDVNDTYSVHLRKPYPPYVREAPCVFERNGKLLMLTSGTTGYYPNGTICYDITDLHGRWKYVNKPCVEDMRHISYNLQFSSVFKVNNDYYAIGDRWLVDFSDSAPDMNEVFKHIYSKGKEEGIAVTEDELHAISKMDVSKGEMLFLKIDFDKNGRPIIKKPKE